MARHLLPAVLALIAQPALAEPDLAQTAEQTAGTPLPGTVLVDSQDQIDALTDGGRYQLMEINDRIVRLDTETGTFDLCRMQDGDWACLAAQDERARLEETIAALTRRVAALERARAEVQARPTVATTATPATGEPIPARVGQGEQQPETVQAAAGAGTPAVSPPVPALPVPQETLPPTNGKPIDISPAAQSEDDDGGLLSRITSLLPSLGW